MNRHHIAITSIDSLNSLTAGNGDFAFTMDITGLQTFPGYYMRGIPLGTYSNWGWHSYPNVNKYRPEQVVRNFLVDGKEVGYYHNFSREKITSDQSLSTFRIPPATM